jgi:type IX secretion system PorP/SprF family membrane protein
MKKLFLKKPILILLLILSQFGSNAQDINFSQFYDLPLLRNPALAGIFTGDVRVTSGFRNQWQSVTVPYRTIALGIEYKKPVGQTSNDFITFGLQMTNDMAGDSKLTRTQVFPVLNYHKSLSGDKNTFLSAAFMAGPVMQRFDPTKLSFDDQFVGGTYSASNPTRQSFTNTSLTYWDPAVGLCFSSVSGENTDFYIGAGLFHFTQPKVAFQPQNDITLNKKWVINGGLTSQVGDMNRIVVYGDYFKQGGASQAQGGLMYMHDLVQRDDNKKISIAAGMFYRLNDALIPVLRLDHYNMSIGATYDINISKLSTASQYRGGLEITLSYKGFTRNQNSDARMVRCPRFY